jgi:Na+/melibiose symporter-like transporter
MYGILPGALTFVCIVLTVFYRLDRAAHTRIQSELETRRAAASPP